MSKETREELIRREFDRWNAGERREIDPQVVQHDVRVHSTMTNATYHGHDGVRRWMAEIDDQFEDWHSSIDEFRDAGEERLLVLGAIRLRGRGSGVGGRVSIVTQRRPSLLLHHVGAKSGADRVTRVTQLADGDRHVIVASKGGTDRHPAWFHNLMANPDTEIEVGRERKLVHARVLDAGERDELWPRLDAIEPAFADYRRWAAEAGREIQMVALEPRVAATASVGRGR